MFIEFRQRWRLIPNTPRNIAGLDAAQDVGLAHLAEALQHRSRGFVG